MNTDARPLTQPADLLAEDLASPRRDALYRAMDYLAARGGPRIAGDPADLANLQAQREAMRRWWLGAPQAAALAQDYPTHCARWSPRFAD